MNSKTPTRKVGAGAVAGALSVLLIWAAQQAGVTVPAEISSAFTTLVSFVTGYFIKDADE